MLDAGTIPETDENNKSIIIAASMFKTRNFLQRHLIFQETRANLELIVLDRHYDLLDAGTRFASSLKSPPCILSPPPV